MSKETKGGRCYFCGEEKTKEDFCFGCNEIVCETCNKDDSPIGGHDVLDHWEGFDRQRDAK